MRRELLWLLKLEFQSGHENKGYHSLIIAEDLTLLSEKGRDIGRITLYRWIELSRKSRRLPNRGNKRRLRNPPPEELKLMGGHTTGDP